MSALDLNLKPRHNNVGEKLFKAVLWSMSFINTLSKIYLQL